MRGFIVMFVVILVFVLVMGTVLDTAKMKEQSAFRTDAAKCKIYLQERNTPWELVESQGTLCMESKGWDPERIKRLGTIVKL